MRIACADGGSAGLYFAIAIKLRAPVLLCRSFYVPLGSGTEPNGERLGRHTGRAGWTRSGHASQLMRISAARAVIVYGMMKRASLVWWG